MDKHEKLNFEHVLLRLHAQLSTCCWPWVYQTLSFDISFSFHWIRGDTPVFLMDRRGLVQFRGFASIHQQLHQISIKILWLVGQEWFRTWLWIQSSNMATDNHQVQWKGRLQTWPLASQPLFASNLPLFASNEICHHHPHFVQGSGILIWWTNTCQELSADRYNLFLGQDSAYWHSVRSFYNESDTKNRELDYSSVGVYSPVTSYWRQWWSARSEISHRASACLRRSTSWATASMHHCRWGHEENMLKTMDSYSWNVIQQKLEPVYQRTTKLVMFWKESDGYFLVVIAQVTNIQIVLKWLVIVI